MNKQILNKEFGFDRVQITKLEAYSNCNYLIQTERGKYILKTYPKSTETLDLVEAENETLLFLQNPKNNKSPEPVPFRDGTYIKCLEIDGQERICRLLSFLEGEFLGEVNPTEPIFESLGTFLARLDLQLQSHDNITYKARQWEWDIQHLNLNKKYIQDIPDSKNRNLVRYFLQQFEQNVVPVLPELRKSIIHNDANEWNVLVMNGKVSSIIDFGDLAYSPLIHELAVALTYACYDKKNPLEWAPIILESYHRILPLEEIEHPSSWSHTTGSFHLKKSRYRSCII